MLLTLLSRFAADPTSAPCTLAKSVAGIPTWYKYLPGETDLIDSTKCIPAVRASEQLPAIGLGIIDILLHLAGIIIVGYVIYGGFLYMTSQGEADKTASAKNTILNAMIGMTIVLMGIAIVSYFGGKFR